MMKSKRVKKKSNQNFLTIDFTVSYSFHFDNFESGLNGVYI